MPSPIWCAPHRPGFVTGLRAEARLAAPLGPVAIGGGLPAGAAEAAARVLAEGVSAIVSFGLCGGLASALRPGDLVVPRAVLWRGRSYPVDAALAAALGGISEKLLLADEGPVADPREKLARFAATGAAAIDLESGAVAEVAARANMPFAVLRAVCDPADAELPPAALIALDAGGRIAPWRVAGSLVRKPGQLAALLALGRAAAVARRALVRRVGDIGHGRFLVP